MKRLEFKLDIDDNTTLEGVLQIVKKDIVVVAPKPIEPILIESNPLDLLTDYWFAKKAIGDTVITIPSEKNIFNLSSPLAGEKFKSDFPTPAGKKGSHILKYESDGEFIRVLNSLNHCVSTKEIPENDQPFETFVVLRIPSGGFIPNEAIVSGSCGLKFVNNKICQIFSNFKGQDHHQPIELDLTTYADKIIVFNFVHTLRSCQLNITDNFSTKTYKVLFPVDKPFKAQSLGTTSHPTITDFFAGGIKVNGLLSEEERKNIVYEYKSLYDCITKNDIYKPIIKYSRAKNEFECVLNNKTDTKIDDLYFRWFKYDCKGPTTSAIDNRVLLAEGLGINILKRDELILPGWPKSDLVCDVYDKDLEYIYTSLPFGNYY